MLEHSDNGSTVDMIYLDFGKTVYAVPYKKHMNKEANHDMLGNVSRWTEE